MAPRKPSAKQEASATSSEVDLSRPLIGHAAAVERFTEALSGDRPHHGWLLHGPQGVGKAAFARRAAAWLAAGLPPAGEGGFGAHPEAPAVRLVAQGAHPDVHWLDRRVGADGKRLPTVIKADMVRQQLRTLNETPAYGGWRVIIVDALDDLNREGTNALLKPLEEPPRNTVLLLISHALSAVLPTIRSRCRALPFGLLANAEMARFGETYAVADGNDAAHWADAVRLAGGRPGLALSLAQNSDLAALARSVHSAAAPGVSTDQRLAVASAIGALKEPARSVLMGLIDEWIAAMVRDGNQSAEENGPAGAPLDPWARAQLADLWADHASALALYSAVNLDVTERMMALFAGLDRVYSGRAA
ncbi:MAG: hypothetical protein KI785_08065 [Devosiaceae bacterium]|nr:hypothetical protein [Devosiaceae bacterium MH13]